MNINEKVKVYLVNSLSAEGVVEYFDEHKLVLISNKQRLVINNPNQNIIMYYVFNNIDYELSKQEALSRDNDKVSDKDALIENATNFNLKIKKLAELKTMAAEAEREEIRKQLTTFHSINTESILGKYGTPSFISTKHNSSEKIDDGNATDARCMSEMPRKTSK